MREAVPSRVEEFTAGRSAARAAMRALGVPAGAVIQGVGGEPIWPAGICGSISHNHAFAVAFVARKSAYEGVGIDIDDHRPITDDIAYDITWRREVRFLQASGICGDQMSAQNFAFSAKEAVFKCQYPLTFYLSLGFHQVRLVDCRDDAKLCVAGWRVRADVGRVLNQITIAQIAIAGHKIIYAAYKE